MSEDEMKREVATVEFIVMVDHDEKTYWVELEVIGPDQVQRIPLYPTQLLLTIGLMNSTAQDGYKALTKEDDIDNG